MLLLSYILSGAMELAFIIKNIQTGYYSFAWSFAFLFLLTSSSIPIETSKLGKSLRKEFKNLGINTGLYDFLLNSLKVVTYLLILLNLVDEFLGLVSAYVLTFGFFIFVSIKYSNINNEDKKK